MAQTPEGAMKALARRAGVTFDELTAHHAAGEKWCWACRCWAAWSDFNRDSTRYDGLNSRCRACTRVKVRVSTKGRTSAFKGHQHSAAAKALLSAAAKGRPSPMVGRRHTMEARQRMSASRRANAKRGAEARTYIDGRHAERMNERITSEYKQWRGDVFRRDVFTCQDCGDAKGGNLHAHHIKPFAAYPELRLEVSNGVTLCETCHGIRHATGNL